MSDLKTPKIPTVLDYALDAVERRDSSAAKKVRERLVTGEPADSPAQQELEVKRARSQGLTIVSEAMKRRFHKINVRWFKRTNAKREH